MWETSGTTNTAQAEAALAVVRFGLGAKPGEIADAARIGATPWLHRQIDQRRSAAYPNEDLKSAKENLLALQNISIGAIYY